MLNYAICGDGQDVNYFAVIEGPEAWPDAGAMCDIGPDEALNAFKGWHPAVTAMIDAVPHHKLWGLFVVRPLLQWHRGRAVLLGDSAHAIVPHHGQGANTTIEDAITLAELLPGTTPGASRRCSADTRRCAGRARGKSSAVPGRRTRSSTFPTARPCRPGTRRSRVSPRTSPESMSSTRCNRRDAMQPTDSARAA